MALKRVFAGFYTRYDGKPIFVVRGLHGRQFFQRRQRALLPHPVHLLLRAGRGGWCAAG